MSKLNEQDKPENRTTAAGRLSTFVIPELPRVTLKAENLYKACKQLSDALPTTIEAVKSFNGVVRTVQEN